MIIDCIGCLHGNFPELPGGDLLIITGDITAAHHEYEFFEFLNWLRKQKYQEKIFISGNHDNFIKNTRRHARLFSDGIIYLCDWGAEFEGITIYGTPWTLNFEGQNPKCKAFGVDTEEELADRYSTIPQDVDILVSHSPPHGILDKTIRGEHVGSKYLRGALEYSIRPK